MVGGTRPKTTEMPQHYFRVRAHRPAERRTNDGPYPRILDGRYTEPAEAADAAETWLKDFGEPGESYCDLFFNGDPEPHSSIFFQGQMDGWPYVPVFGIWNRHNAPWPISYVDENNPGGNMLPMPLHPSAFFPEYEAEIKQKDEQGKHKQDEDSTTMKLEGQDDQEDEDDEWEDEEDEGENGSDDDGSEGEEDMDESDADDDDGNDGDGDAEDEDENEDEGEGDDSESEGDGDEEDENEEEAESDSENTDEEDDGDGEEDGESAGDEGEDGDEGDDDGDGEGDTEQSSDEAEQAEPPVRLPIFAKMRGPKGWRKRSDAEDLNMKNVFGLKIGVTNPEGATPGQQEKDVRCEIQFIETDELRTHGTLRIKLPEGITPDDFTFARGWMEVGVPYQDEA